ncbi:hypothetical protein BELL_0907g00020 [Botrytis elliptica]|uniref:Uncharacterized protein n=1 Tax=Botrytis elliptica TaxID=278938 RepID=A0A4Z1J0J9_9HELO|nr:hypothetical protein BELL_0907g00020 [Botrytis elliptica]
MDSKIVVAEEQSREWRASRSSKRRAERQQVIAEPIKGFALTVRGLALEDGFKDRGLGPSEPGLSLGLVVGYVLLEEDPNRTFDQSETNKKKPVGADRPANFRRFDANPIPILIITNIIDTIDNNFQMRYYALMSPKNGIFTPNKVKIDNIYFVHEFPLAVAIRPEILATPTDRKVDFKRSKPTSKLVFERHISLANYLILLAQNFAIDSNKSTLQDIEASVKDAVADFEHRPAPNCIALRNFCEVDRYLTIEEAQDVVAIVIIVVAIPFVLPPPSPPLPPPPLTPPAAVPALRSPHSGPRTLGFYFFLL